MRRRNVFLSRWPSCVGLLLLSVATSLFAQPRDPRDPLQDTADDPFLDSLQVKTFRYFWETTPPQNGLAADRYPTRRFSSIAAVGFALTAYPVGVERGYVSREQAVERVLTTLRFFWAAPQGADATKVTGYQGFFYHFLDPTTGYRFETTELSTIDTALLLAGMLFCQSYFDQEEPREREIRALADSIYRRANWQWFLTRPPLVSMAWRPERGFSGNDWKGFNEGMILYILALASPTHPVEPDAWEQWCSTYVWESFYGYEHVNFSPLFGHQYSHIWIDFRGIQDAYMKQKGIDYVENSRRATYAQREYAARNPMKWKAYSREIWGLTACDGPGNVKLMYEGEERQFRKYSARGASARQIVDDGTIAPTAAGGSLAFAPEICLPALKAMKERYGSRIWREYGFIDAFNPSFVTPEHPEGWFDHDYLGIDQGPILLMTENLRTGFVWKTMKKNPYIIAGLRKAGFEGGWLESTSSEPRNR